VNERIAEIVAKWPDRFVGLGTVHCRDPDLAFRLNLQ
jgi:predicted TIM-barrel fold metal-dependent hydrolase